MAISVLKIILVLIILSAMIIILLTVDHFLGHAFESNNDDVEELRHDIKERKNIITDKSTFRHLVEVQQPIESKKDNFKVKK